MKGNSVKMEYTKKKVIGFSRHYNLILHPHAKYSSLLYFTQFDSGFNLRAFWFYSYLQISLGMNLRIKYHKATLSLNSQYTI